MNRKKQKSLDMADLYYTPPSDEVFLEVKEKAMALWSTMGSEPSYSEGKIARIKDIPNVGDNFMYMVAMFDSGNQRLLAMTLSSDACDAIRERLIAGEMPETLIYF